MLIYPTGKYYRVWKNPAKYDTLFGRDEQAVLRDRGIRPIVFHSMRFMPILRFQNRIIIYLSVNNILI